jgi:hypothetical protein
MRAGPRAQCREASSSAEALPPVSKQARASPSEEVAHDLQMLDAVAALQPRSLQWARTRSASIWK